ncbi:MAG: VIT domain-containing protein [Candidatus Rifleibacteriota bacterium]
MNKYLFVFFAAFLCFLSFSSPALADGMIFPVEHKQKINSSFIIRPPSRPAGNFTVPLSIKKHHVKFEINNLAASTAVDQTFYNHENRTIEGLYIFPLPINASISEFAMDIDGKMTKGELLDSEKAKKIYEDIVRQMRDPGLLEYMGQGLFKTRIYPIKALSDKDVKIAYQEALKIEGNLIRYVYPLDIDRYSQEPMKDVMIQGTIKSDLPITSIYSPTHKISINRKSETEVVVGFEAESHEPVKDFVVYYAVSEKDLSVSVITNRPDPSEDGTFMLMLAPRFKQQDEKAPAVDVALVLDTSGSMAGKKFTQAQQALEFCINALSDESSFFLCNFSTVAESYKSELIKMNKDRRQGALNYISNLEAMGGTNISEAFNLALEALNKSETGNPKYVVFVTDGKPTAGITDPESIIKEVQKHNKSNARIFSFGVGDNLNAKLVDKLANENHGASDYVSENEDLEIKISTLFSKLTHPALTNVDLKFHGVDVKQIYPREVGDVFRQSNIILLGQYTSPGAARITLSGTIKDQRVKIDYEADFPRQEKQNSFIGKIWATRKIGFLLEQIRKNGSNEELKNEIISLAKRYGILTPYTSFLVLEDESPERINLRKAMRPKGSIKSDAFKAKRERYSLDSLQSESSGADAVGASRQMNTMKSAAAPVARPARSVEMKSTGINMPDFKEVEGKTFYHIENKWVDSEIKGKKADKLIKTWSSAYFELLKKYPELGSYFSLGEKVIVKFNNQIIEIDPDQGLEQL